MAKATKTEVKTEKRERRWLSPNRRARGYASELKEKVHQRGDKEGKPLTDFEAGLRVGSLQMQNDHIGMYKYKKALAEGKSVEEAKAYSREIGGKK